MKQSELTGDYLAFVMNGQLNDGWFMVMLNDGIRFVGTYYDYF